MKKYLKITQVNEKAVPPELDAAILAAAALQSRRIKFRRNAKIAVSFAAAAALLSVCSTLFISIYGNVPEVKKMRYSQTELAALGDFSAWEQEQFIYNEIVNEYTDNYKNMI